MPQQFYRFQKTDQLERESYSEFLSDIFFMIGGEENEWKELEQEDKEKWIEEVNQKWQFAIDLWWEKYQEKYSNVENPTKYLIDTLSELDEDSIWDFMMKHKLNGVFAIKTEDFLNKEDLFESSRNDELGVHNDYLLLLEGEEIAYFGKDYGYLITPNRIISVEKTPQRYIK